MKEIVSTIDAVAKLLYQRRCGNTTRQVNFAIQQLFEDKIVKCIDHYSTTFEGLEAGETNKQQLSKMMMKTILRRLDMEHGHLVRNDKVKVDYENFTIELID